MDFPPTIPVASLLATHPQYNRTLVERLTAYYEGGVNFPHSSELVRTALEDSGQPIGAAVRAIRDKLAFYTNYFADAIIDPVATITKCPIEIEDGTPLKFYKSLERRRRWKPAPRWSMT